MSDRIHIMQESFRNGKTGEDVPGVTIIVDGKLREVLDVLIRRSSESEDYVQIMHEILLAGVNELMKKK